MIGCQQVFHIVNVPLHQNKLQPSVLLN